MGRRLRAMGYYSKSQSEIDISECKMKRNWNDLNAICIFREKEMEYWKVQWIKNEWFYWFGDQLKAIKLPRFSIENPCRDESDHNFIRLIERENNNNECPIFGFNHEKFLINSGHTINFSLSIFCIGHTFFPHISSIAA